MTVELTPEQARAVAELAGRVGVVTLHQLAHDEEPVGSEDVYVTPHGAASGYRIARDGTLSEIGKTLPAR